MSIAEQASGGGAVDNTRKYDEVVPVLGFREYWHPACLSKDVDEKGHVVTIMNEPILFVRRAGEVYAMIDECPHRGTKMSRGSCEFPGSKTITCIYHGWTFDVTNGRCVAALTDGPDSPIVNKARIRTYPTTECRGIIWVWMGKKEPVAPEQDIPEFIRTAPLIRVFQRKSYGNWRWHIENGALGHALMLHRDALYMKFKPFPAAVTTTQGVLAENDGAAWVEEHPGRPLMSADYPGLGVWPPKTLTLPMFQEDMSPLQGIRAKVSMRLPAVARITHFPVRGAMLYEFPVQIDADHYNYIQIVCCFSTNVLEQAWFLLRYYLWGKPVGMIQFNSQDTDMVGDSEDSAKRRNGRWFPPSRLYKADQYYFAWRDYVVRNARDLQD